MILHYVNDYHFPTEKFIAEVCEELILRYGKRKIERQAKRDLKAHPKIEGSVQVIPQHSQLNKYVQNLTRNVNLPSLKKMSNQKKSALGLGHVTPQDASVADMQPKSKVSPCTTHQTKAKATPATLMG